MNKNNSDSYNNDLLAITHFGENPKDYFNAVAPPLIMTSLHVFEDTYHQTHADKDNEYIYGRCSNPTVNILEEKIALLEHGNKALAFSSGMAAAIAAILSVCKAGDHIISINNSYSTVSNFINGYGKDNLNLSVTYVKGYKPEEFESAIKPNTKLIILESPTTFLFSLVDIEAVANIAKKHNIKTYLDNTYCTPLFQKPLDLGIDIVMHALTKYIGGHSDILGGCLVSKDEHYMRFVKNTIRELYGSVIGPMEAWLAIRGLRTLDVRVRQHAKTGLEVAKFLEKHPKINCVYYPGLKSHPQYDLMKKQQKGNTGLLGFELKGTKDDVVTFSDSLKLFHLGCSWGGYESLLIAPLFNSSPETHEFYGIGETYIRIHCGLEGSENLIEDLTQALNKI